MIYHDLVKKINSESGGYIKRKTGIERKITYRKTVGYSGVNRQQTDGNRIRETEVCIMHNLLGDKSGRQTRKAGKRERMRKSERDGKQHKDSETSNRSSDLRNKPTTADKFIQVPVVSQNIPGPLHRCQNFIMIPTVLIV